MLYIAIILAYLYIALVCYVAVTKKFSAKKWEKIWYAFFWPVLIPLYIIHYIHNKF